VWHLPKPTRPKKCLRRIIQVHPSRGVFIHSLISWWFSFDENSSKLGKERPRRNLKLWIKFLNLWTHLPYLTEFTISISKRPQDVRNTFFPCIYYGPFKHVATKSRILWWSLHYPKILPNPSTWGSKNNLLGIVNKMLKAFVHQTRSVLQTLKLRTTKRKGGLGWGGKSFESKMQ